MNMADESDYDCTVLEQERALIGAALCSGQDIKALMAALPVSPNHFAIPFHCACWTAAKLLNLRGMPVSPEALIAELRRVGIGEHAQLEHLISLAASAKFVCSLGDGASLVRYAQRNARVVLEVALRRELLAVTERAHREAKSRGGSPTGLADSIGEIVLDGIARIQPLRLALAEIANSMKERTDP